MLTPTGAYFDHVVTILMENQDLNSVLAQGTYQAGLASQYTLLTGYTADAHPSEPNYCILTGADTTNCSKDGICCGQNTGPTIIDRLESAGLTWKAYAEDATGQGTCSFNPPRGGDHFGFLDFKTIQGNSTRCTNFLTTTSPKDPEFINALSNPSTAPNYLWLTPNDKDNSHDTPISTGDAYLAALVPQILNSPTFQTDQRSVLFIVYDEGNDQTCTTGGQDCVYASWSGPATKKAYTSAARYDHYSYVHTILANWGLTALNSRDASAPSMNELFNPNTAPRPLSLFFNYTESVWNVPITFNASCSGGTSPYNYGWSFGDKFNATGSWITHTYSQPGIYNVTLIIIDSSTPVMVKTFSQQVSVMNGFGGSDLITGT